MQLPTWLGHVVTSGEVSLFADEKEALNLKFENKKINLDVINKKFVKEVIGSMGGTLSFTDTLDQIRIIAIELRDEGLTMTLSYKGKLVVTMGSEAKPKLSSFLTGSNAIEINNLRTLIELGV